MRIIYFDIDSLRPDHLGCYGYGRDTSPNIDQIAQEGVVFGNCFTSDSPCVPSRAALFSGRFGVQNGVVTHWGPGSEFRFPAQDTGLDQDFRQDMPLFSRHLRQYGWDTISFSSFADRHQAPWFLAGWNETHNFTLKMGSENADEVADAVIPWLETKGTKDQYFLHIHFWDPHRKYTMPQEWADRFKSDSLPPWPDADTLAVQQTADYGPCTPTELWRDFETSPVATMPDAIANIDDLHKMIDGYDGTIRYVDHYIGLIRNTLKKLGVWDDTAIIVSADHGESMGEHAVFGNHVNASESTHRVPLIIRWPDGGRHHVKDDRLLYQLDLTRTLCELLDIPAPEGWQGQPFTDAIKGGIVRSQRQHLIWSHGLYTCQRAVRTKEWLLLYTYHPGLYAWDPVSLYHVSSDPYETNNLVNTNSEKVSELSVLLDEWYRKHVYGPTGSPDPMQQVIATGPWKYIKLSPWLERLRQHDKATAALAIEERLALWPKIAP